MQYQKKLDQALRGVVRAALIEAATDGLPGDHHFYVTFRTKAPGVEISDALHAQYEEEMTIVLQHQFWGLEVHDDWFTVSLSFNRVSEPLVIPFDAVSAFLARTIQYRFHGRRHFGYPARRACTPMLVPHVAYDDRGFAGVPFERFLFKPIYAVFSFDLMLRN